MELGGFESSTSRVRFGRAIRPNTFTQIEPSSTLRIDQRKGTRATVRGAIRAL